MDIRKNVRTHAKHYFITYIIMVSSYLSSDPATEQNVIRAFYRIYFNIVGQ